MNILVVLASYNGEKYIKEQINSILNQKDVNVTLRIFDDCSSDSTIDVINSIKDVDSRVEVIKNITQSGSAAKNFLISLCSLKDFDYTKFDFIALSDQDDLWLPEKLYRAINELTNQNADLYMSNLIMWEEESNKNTLIKKNYKQKKFDFLFEGGSAGCTYVFSVNFYVILTNNVSKVGLDEWKYLSHDWLIYFLARLNCIKVFIDDQAYIHYRIHKNNVHGQLNKNSLSSLRKRISYVLSGWYNHQINGFINFLDPKSIEYRIYLDYNDNWFSRLYVLLKYNFQLMRSKKKFIKFFILSLIGFKKKKFKRHSLMLVDSKL
jgi:rhamnosyltransferase